MHDWKEIVRRRLTPLPLEPGRRDEVIEELSHQLEDAYKEALSAGVSEPEALGRSLAQFNDWENLRKDVFRAVKAEELPVWHQRGILSPKRPWVWATLLLALALLSLAGFRQALTAVSVSFKADPWQESFFSTRALAQMERQAIAQADARALAFVALHHPDINEAARDAEKAIALDAHLTWISARFARVLQGEHNPAPWIARLKTWDPDNAVPYLLEAGTFFDKSPLVARWPSLGIPELRRALVAESDFRLPMRKAYAAPKYDNYAAQRFELDRAVFEQQGWDRPDLLMFAEASQPYPNLFATRIYAQYLVEDVGETAEKAGRNEEAAAQYRTVAQFGVRMERASTDIERLIGIAIRKISYKRLLPLLRLQGRTEEAALLECDVADLNEGLELTGGYRLTERAASRAAPLVLISGVVVVVFAAATLAWLGAVTLLRWKENGSSLLNYFASVASVAVPLLLLASLGLYGAYYPYVRHINQFENAGQLVRDVGPLWGTLAGLHWGLLHRGSWLPMMLWPTVWCIVVAVIGIIILRWVANRRESGGLPE